MCRSLSCLVAVPVVVFFCFMAIVGCDRRLRFYPPKINAETSAAAAMEMYDANKDGKLDAEELKKVASLGKLAQDGVVSADRIADQIKKWSAGGIGRARFTAQVFHNNKALVGADVKFVPEKFLGAGYVVATGKTGATGAAIVTVAADGPPGIPLGFYRVEITKDGEDIPAKYNTETTLSVGFCTPVNDDATFNLAY